ncbi:hypothetical protein tb265_47200 [Gemmatimonadetes bacterium T265]|nr:hypothetical protein tb265_47200 [Gemmatimonadetes bacterium T265]
MARRATAVAGGVGAGAWWVEGWWRTAVRRDEAREDMCGLVTRGGCRRGPRGGVLGVARRRFAELMDPVRTHLRRIVREPFASRRTGGVW